MHFCELLVGSHRVVLDDLAFEDPDLDADDAVRRTRNAVAEVDVGSERVQRHAAFAVPFRARDFGAAQTARDVDPDADRAKAQRRLHGTLHGPAERDAALELLRNAFGDQRRIDLGLSDFEDVQVNFRRRQPREIGTQALDLFALLADQDAGACSLNRNAALLVRTLDYDLRNAGLALLLHDVSADGAVLVQQPAVLAASGEPTAVPRSVDA